MHKTWLFGGVNQALPANGTALADHRALLLALKTSLVTAAHVFGGSIVRSCDSTAVSGSDLIVASGDLVWDTPGNAHSWFTLALSGLGSFRLVVALDQLDQGVGGPRITVVASQSGAFGPGSTTARPTAADEQVWLSGAWCGTTHASPSFACALHVLGSTDGEALRAVVLSAGVPVLFWAIDKPQGPIAGWSTPQLGVCLGADDPTESVLTYTAFKAAIGRARVGAVNASLYPEFSSYAGQPSGQRASGPSTLTGEWDLFAVRWRSETAGAYGPLTGQTVGAPGWWDTWLGVALNGLPVDYAPGDGTRTRIQIGIVVLPWNGSIALTA